MPRRKKYIEGVCQLCGSDDHSHMMYYIDHPFIDGLTYQEICDCCVDVPIFDLTDDLEFFWTQKLKTVQELMESGWLKEEAQASISGVKKAVQAAKKKGKI